MPIVQNVPGVPKRTVHRHDFPAVDVPLVARRRRRRRGVAARGSVQSKLADSLTGLVCVTQAGGIRVILDAVALGHSFPSGASQDRRLWIEVNAYRGTDATPYYSSGHVEAGASPVDVQSVPDPDRWLLRDCMFGVDGGEVSMFWQAYGATDDNALPAIGAFLPDPKAYLSHIEQFFPRDGTPLPGALPDRVTLNVWLQPVGLDVLNDLVASHDLDPGIVAAMPTFPVAFGHVADGSLQQQLVWTAQAAADAGIPPFVDTKDNHTVTCVGTMAQPSPNPAVEPHALLTLTRPSLRVARHLEHRRAEAALPEHALRSFVADHRREHHAGCAHGLEARHHGPYEPLPHPAPPRVGRDEDIVQRAVRVEKHVPVALLEGAVGVAQDVRGAGRDENHGVRPGELSREPPRVALLHVFREEEPRRVDLVVHAHERPRQLGNTRQIALLGRPDDHFVHGRESTPARPPWRRVALPLLPD